MMTERDVAAAVSDYEKESVLTFKRCSICKAVTGGFMPRLQATVDHANHLIEFHRPVWNNPNMKDFEAPLV